MIKQIKSSLNLIKTWSEMIKIEHSFFSFPFVMAAAFLAEDYMKIQNPEFKINFGTWFWMIGALVGARSAGMTLNRIIDALIDSKNPRTSGRAIPSSKISKSQSWIFTFFSIFLLVYSSFQLPKLCQYLVPIVVIWIWVYPYLKRFTLFAHLFLGITLGGACLGGWIAVSGNLDTWAPVFLALGVSFWVTGFDIIYGIQDLDFDRKQGLHSVPVVFGVENSKRITKFLHFLMLLFFYIAGELLNLALFYKIGLVLIGLLLYFEDRFFDKPNLYLNLNLIIPFILFLSVL
jgi:4-hydroxybenzoate polyprenyltransferase